MPEFSFWGVTCAPLATPSETCLPHRLRITRAVCRAQARSPRRAAVTGPSSTCLLHARRSAQCRSTYVCAVTRGRRLTRHRQQN